MILNIFILLIQFIPNIQNLYMKELINFNSISELHELPIHIQSARIKSFGSTYKKLNRRKTDDIYCLNDLLGFRFVFYSKEDLLRFYHYCKLDRSIMSTSNYIVYPKKNGYKSLHFNYNNPWDECPIRQIECQLYIIDDYYNSLYGTALYNKNYTELIGVSEGIF
jgi:ppGpp synthetase/RelA/SpoT-type nucleotidyltranferase